MTELQQQIQRVIGVPRALIDRILLVVRHRNRDTNKPVRDDITCETCKTCPATICVPYKSNHLVCGFLNICDVCSHLRHTSREVGDPKSIVSEHSDRLKKARLQLRTTTAFVITVKHMTSGRVGIYRCIYCSKLDAYRHMYTGCDGTLCVLDLCVRCCRETADISRGYSTMICAPAHLDLPAELCMYTSRANTAMVLARDVYMRIMEPVAPINYGL